MGNLQNDSISLDLYQPATWDTEPKPTNMTGQYAFIWLVLLLTFGLQFSLLMFRLLKCWSYDRRLKQVLQSLPSTEKLHTTAPSFIIHLPEDLKNAKPPAYSRYDAEVARFDLSTSCYHKEEEAWSPTDSPYTPFAWDLVQN
ncbi:hypothetical protein DPEC_G00114510 [Dallia pectoralis]|uniref:Uncharacterized protein n=1 Tax=Dallia pectoralis TaxID=75939 RepID=A0ACC2GUL3_DALPE|nr:hypothetical protein DPEC_G00114510 [Dallia pectoralis]